MRRLALFVGFAVSMVALVGAVLLAGSAGAFARNHTMTDLGHGLAHGINERGQVVGGVAATDNYGHAFLWANGKMTDLGTLGGNGSTAYAINDRSQIVGCSPPRASSLCHAFLWENGTMTDLGTLGGGMSIAYGINDRGQVVGESGLAEGSRHAFLWENGKMTDLGTLGGCCSEARGINDRGQVVGSSYAAESSTGLHGFLWENGKMTDLGSLGADPRGRVWVTPLGINESGQVVGHSAGYIAPGRGFTHAFLWEKGAITDLGTLGGRGSGAYAIDDRGRVVGESAFRRDDFVPWHAFVWQNGKMTDLGTRRGDRSRALDINDRGQIVGYWSLRNTVPVHAVLWSGVVLPVAPAARAPRLTDRGRGTDTALRASHSGLVATVSRLVGVDRRATVTLSVRDRGTAEQLTMQTGSKLGATTLTQQATTMRTMVGSSRTLAVKALLPAEQLRRGTLYQLALTATGATGKSSKLKIRFLG